MSSFGSLATAISGLYAARSGLNVTGHNVSNTNTIGYTRQRVELSEFQTKNIGTSGNTILTVGLGTNVSAIQQIRDIFLDKAYRNEASRFNFYDIRAQVCEEIATIFGELQGSGRLSETMDDMWKALQELSQHPSGIEARTLFLSNCAKFADKANSVYDNLYKYQELLNGEVIGTVQRMNQIGVQIGKLSEQICIAEGSGDTANDLRDQRNNLLDELSTFAKINYFEDHNKQLYVQIEGNDYIVGSSVKTIGLKQASADYPFVIPVYTSSTNVLPPDDTIARPVFTDLTKTVSAERGNDFGSLKSLLLARGDAPANYTTDPTKSDLYIIPRIMRQFDVLVNKVVTLINDTFAPQTITNPPSPVDAYGKPGLEVFTRKKSDRYEDDNGAYGDYIKEDPSNLNTLYTFGRIEINTELYNDWNRLATSTTGDQDDNSLIERILQQWTNVSWIDPQTNALVTNPYAPRVDQFSNPATFSTYFTEMITRLGQVGEEANTFVDSERTLIQKLDSDRLSISGVSLDEEMTNMMKYQHAYNAASRLVNEIDSMLDRIINGLIK